MEKLTPTFDDQEARRLVQEGDVEQAMRLVHAGMQQSISVWLHRCFPTLSPEDLADIWSGTLHGLMCSIQSGRYDVARPLVRWVCRIAYNRATDAVRREVTRKRTRTTAAATLERIQSGRPWLNLDGAERAEAMELIRTIIASLPSKQQIVLRAFVDHYPESRHLHVLQREVSQITGQLETMASVKRALQEGRLKVQRFLRRRGYAPEGTRDDP
jgi:DNA-directed RNA polymerase specialized sigma24 family protein